MSRALRVNPIMCDGSGLCAELIPERVRLDEWGYPIIDPRPITPELEDHAERAVAACPTMALLLARAAKEPATST
ncbi:MAG: ferredoxin [Gaiellaceae bacterium]|nr:ferredoxin [Gaiellaceae bacterium]